MRRLLLASFTLGASALAMWACGGDDANANGGGDAGADGSVDAASDSPIVPHPDVATPPTIKCMLDNGSDPVQLCTQKMVLAEQNQHGFVRDAGAIASWSSSPPNTSDGLPHDVRDDLAFGAAIAAYHQSANTYGDTEITPALDATLVSLAPVIEAELATPLADYAGDVYFRLRAIADGMRVLGQVDHGTKIDALAESYARAIYTQYVHMASGAADAGAAGVVIGPQDGQGNVTYAPDRAAQAAYALIDMAALHAMDDPTNASAWQTAALGALDRLDARAKDPQTGMYYALLTTSGDPGHDALADAKNGYPTDTQLIDVQATLSLALFRAAALVDASPQLAPPTKSYPFRTRARALIAAANGGPDGSGPSLWDGTQQLDVDGGDGGIGTGTGYMEGWSPSTSTLFANKPTRGNALAYAAIRHAEIDQVLQFPYHWQLPILRTVLTKEMPDHTSLLTVFPDQVAYARAASRGFDLAELPGDAGPEPRATSYRAQAIDDGCEGLDEYWYGIAH